MKLDCLSPEQWNAVFSISGESARHALAKRMGRGFLACPNCKKQVGLTTRDVLRYLAEGWPKCCENTFAGGVMHYFPNRQQYERETRRGVA